MSDVVSDPRCNADVDSPCTGGCAECAGLSKRDSCGDCEPCMSCKAEEAYWYAYFKGMSREAMKTMCEPIPSPEERAEMLRLK